MCNFDVIQTKILNNEISEMEAASQIIELIRQDKYDFNIDDIPYDDSEDLLQSFWSHLYHSLSNYDPAKSSLKTYVHAVLNFFRMSVNYKTRTTEKLNQAKKELARIEYAQKESFYSCTSAEHDLFTQGYTIEDFLLTAKRHFKSQDFEHIAEHITVLVLHHSYYASFKDLKIISKYAGISLPSLLEIHQKLLDSLKSKILRYQRIEHKNNTRYFHRILERDLTEPKLMKPQDPRDIVENFLITVPYTDMEKYLGLSDRVLKTMVSKSMVIMDILREFLYSEDDENLFSNRQPQQKEGDAGIISGTYNSNTKGRRLQFRSDRRRIILFRKQPDQGKGIMEYSTLSCTGR